MSLDPFPSDAELRRMAEERSARRSGSIVLLPPTPTGEPPAIVTPAMVTRPKNAKAASPSEHVEQRRLFEWIDGTRDRPGARETIDPALGFVFAIPNGGHRTPAVAAKMKAEGVRAGYPDIGWDLRRGRFAGFRGELKRVGSGDVSPLQAEWHVWLERQGLYVVTAHGWESMRDQLLWYLHLTSRE